MPSIVTLIIEDSDGVETRYRFDKASVSLTKHIREAQPKPGDEYVTYEETGWMTAQVVGRKIEE